MNVYVFNSALLFSGTLSIDGESLSLEGGRAYVEKDWGSKFPKTHVWLQAELRGTSLFLSVAVAVSNTDQVFKRIISYLV